MAISPVYCTHRDVEDVYPNINDHDSKEAIYGWSVDSGDRYVSHNTGIVTALFEDGRNLGSAQPDQGNVDGNGQWYYDSSADALYYYSTSAHGNPNDRLMESGEDFSTLMTRIIKNASRYLDSRIDANLPRDQFRDKEGNFDYVIVRTTALIAAYFLTSSSDRESQISESFLEEANFHIDELNQGKTRLSSNVTGDAHKGIIREVTSPQNANPLYIVDVRGSYSGVFDLIKIIVTTGGAIGTAKFSTFTRNEDGLKANESISDDIINGQYQHIGYGMEVRFAGKDDSSVATANDEWELEVHGYAESMADSIGSNRSIKATRRGY
tara:strand:- start:700 stop:1671 length:972 start_codon:yes stop_codon:yes gene_type:complete